MKTGQQAGPELEMLIKDSSDAINEQLMLGRGSVDDVYDFLKQRYAIQLSIVPAALEQRLLALGIAYDRRRKALGKVEFMQTPRIRRLNSHNWYQGPTDDARMWHSLVRRLRESNRTEEEIAETDRGSTAVVSLLHPPGAAEFKHFGMVVGHVQSGKTGNIAAVIAKAAETPYRFFLVLSGMTTALREQTQSRLDADLVARHPQDWHSWTTTDDGGDSVAAPHQGFQFDTRGKQLAVLKKNASVLRRFLKKLQATMDTSPLILQETPFLIIDDEADQASVNSPRARQEITVINGLIRDIISLLPRVSYVGYTATPYANVLIDPTPPADRPDDLYPSDFIHALRPPKAYFGPERLFGRGLLLGEENEEEPEGLDMIRHVPEEELDSLRPARQSDPFEFSVTASLADAIRYYFVCLAVRAARGQAREHSTMLIHTSHLINVHQQAEAALHHYVDHLVDRLRANDEALLLELEELWEHESARIPASEMGCTHVAFSTVREFLLEQAEEIEIVVDNSQALTRIDYERPGTRKYIVIGGNVLSRGLTLEGLMVSFFVRSSRQYDTLMQMGRWFGFREGYADLPRVWMEPSIQRAFRDLAMVEAEIREDMTRYEQDQITPMQFAVRIRQIPGMAITAPARMQRAVMSDITYAGERVQTFRFNRCDEEWLTRNWQAGHDLVAAIERNNGDYVRTSRGFLYQEVAYQHIRRFLQAYQPHETHSNLESSLVTGFIDKSLEAGENRYLDWNVLIISPAGRVRTAERPLGSHKQIPTIVRSRLKATPGPIADIKALMSLGDMVADLGALNGKGSESWKEAEVLRNEKQAPPLLLLYPIDRVSEPVRTNGVRTPMNAVTDILGMALIFPETRGGANRFVSVRLPALDDETHEDDSEEQEFAELFDTSADDDD